MSGRLLGHLAQVRKDGTRSRTEKVMWTKSELITGNSWWTDYLMLLLLISITSFCRGPIFDFYHDFY